MVTPEAEQMIEKYKDWLNECIRLTDDQGAIPYVTREMFDEFNDPPRIELDQQILPKYVDTRRYIVMLCNPYHDEGGPSILTGIFIPQYNDDFQPEGWELAELICEFDTNIKVIYEEGELTFLPQRLR